MIITKDSFMTKKTFLIILIGISCFFILSASEVAFADVISFDNPLDTDSFTGIIDSLVDYIFIIAIVLAPLMIIIGGSLFITAGGNVSQIEQAKKIITWTAIGLLIILLAKGITSIIKSMLGITN